MVSVGKCSKCDKRLPNIKVEDIVLVVGSKPTWKGFSFVCPFCHTILGVQVNPFAVADETVAAMANTLKKK